MKIEDLFPNVMRWEIPDKYYQNLVLLLPALNDLEDAIHDYIKITNGFRTWVMHKEIYKHINDARVIQGKPERPIPIHSAHLSGNAVDLFDPYKKIQAFLADQKFLTDNALWAEGFQWTQSWAHVQRIAYGSFVPGGSRFFRPF